MRKILVEAATFKPLEVELIKVRPEVRGLVSETDNLLIADFLEAAIEGYQEFTNGILCRSTWDLYLDRFPRHHGEISTPAPLASVTSITYLDASGASQTLAEPVYSVDISDPLSGRIALTYGQCWPSACCQANAVTVRFLAGYANAAAIPHRIKDGLIAYIQEMLTGADLGAVYHERWSAFRRIPV